MPYSRSEASAAVAVAKPPVAARAPWMALGPLLFGAIVFSASLAGGERASRFSDREPGEEELRRALREAAETLYFLWESRSRCDYVNWPKVEGLALRLWELAERGKTLKSE